MCLCTLHNYVKFVCVHCTIAVFCRTFNSKTVVFAFHCWMGRTVRWLQIIISFNLVELTFIPYHFHIEIISLLKVKSNGFFVFWMLEGSIGRFKAFKPLTLFLLRGGGSILRPTAVLFYITQKVLVWGCWHFLTFPKYPKPSL